MNKDSIKEIIVTNIENGQKLKYTCVPTDYGYRIKKIEFIKE
jgi:hypothetical protein